MWPIRLRSCLLRFRVINCAIYEIDVMFQGYNVWNSMNSLQDKGRNRGKDSPVWVDLQGGICPLDHRKEEGRDRSWRLEASAGIEDYFPFFMFFIFLLQSLRTLRPSFSSPSSQGFSHTKMFAVACESAQEKSTATTNIAHLRVRNVPG